VNPVDITTLFSPSARWRSGPSGKETVSKESAAGVTAAVARPWAERDHADQEDPPPADVVADPAEEQREPGRAQREGGRDPLHVGLGEAEAGADGRQRHVEDREVDGEGELGGEQQQEHQQLSAGHGGRAYGLGLLSEGHDINAPPDDVRQPDTCPATHPRACH
jgi:hypothetical protein